jgi:choline dehydrogenase-like flavoprotein
LVFRDARQLPAGTRLETEICIVGAGAAGITLALDLRDAGFRVLLLESGGFEPEEQTQALYQGENRGVFDFDPDVSRLRLFGGSTNHWAGWCRPLEPEDFRPADPSDPRTWPLSRADLEPYYRRAQTLCELGPYNYDDLAPWLQASGMAALELDARRLKTALFQVSPPTRFGATYRDALEQARNVTVCLHANVLEAVADPAAAKVLGVRGTSLEGPPFDVAARIVVLATGGLENARLLLLSNKVQSAGLGNGHDLVGRYFMDHPWMTGAGFATFATPVPDLRLYLDQTTVWGTTVFGALTPGTAAEPGIGGFRILLTPSRRLVEGVNSLRTITAALGSGHLPPDGFWHHLGRVFADYDAVVDATYKTVFHARTGPFSLPEPGSGPIVGAILDVNVEQFPNPDSRVTLSDQRDVLGQNRLVVDWRPGAAEKRSIRRALELVADEFGRLGVGRVRISDMPAGDSWPAGLQGSRHHLGTTRMSDNPRAGVVDANCRVHGVDNLYIAGSSVFPSSGFSNPTLTIVALALRLGFELRRRLGQEGQ